jgi:hypothetical protein
MIRTIEQFLNAYEENSTDNIAFDVLGGGFFYEDAWGSERVEMDYGLIRQMERLGIIYAFGGELVINPMAMRVLARMRGEGKALSGESFHEEVEASKEQYHAEHPGEAAEFESAPG